MPTEAFQRPKFEQRLYCYGGWNQNSLISFGNKNSLPIEDRQPFSQKDRILIKDAKIYRPRVLPNPRGFFMMHPSTGNGLKDLVYFSSDDPHFIEQAIKMAKSFQGSPRYRAHRWVLRKPHIIRYLSGQKIVDLHAAQMFSPEIVLTKEYEGIEWSDKEITPTEDKIHRPILRTFFVDAYQDYDVSSHLYRRKEYFIYKNGLIQFNYITRSLYTLTVIGFPRGKFSHGVTFRLNKNQLKTIKKKVLVKILWQTKTPQWFDEESTSDDTNLVGVLHADEQQVKFLIGAEPSSDFIRLRQSIVMVGDSEYQPLPFMMNGDPDKKHYLTKSLPKD